MVQFHQDIMDKEVETLQNVINIASEFIIEYGFQILGAIIILIIGLQVAKWVAKLVLKLCERGNIDVTLSKFIANFAKVIVLVFVIIIALGCCHYLFSCFCTARTSND